MKRALTATLAAFALLLQSVTCYAKALSASDDAEQMGFSADSKVGDEDLGGMRGGMRIGGMNFSFVFSTQTIINGVMQKNALFQSMKNDQMGIEIVLTKPNLESITNSNNNTSTTNNVVEASGVVEAVGDVVAPMEIAEAAGNIVDALEIAETVGDVVETPGIAEAAYEVVEISDIAETMGDVVVPADTIEAVEIVEQADTDSVVETNNVAENLQAEPLLSESNTPLGNVGGLSPAITSELTDKIGLISVQSGPGNNFNPEAIAAINALLTVIQNSKDNAVIQQLNQMDISITNFEALQNMNTDQNTMQQMNFESVNSLH